jgi:group I intron endonuclease
MVDMATGYIYKITCKANGKVYVGQTLRSILIRFKQHVRCAENGTDNYIFHNAIRKYGAKNFSYEELERYEDENKDSLKTVLDEAEKRIIKQYDSFKSGYNSNTGGVSFTGSIEEEGYMIPIHKSGITIISESVFPKAMTDMDIGKMVHLSRFIIAKNNMLGYHCKGKEIAYSSKKIGELLGLNDRRGKGFVSKMIGLGIICREDSKNETRYFINPAYFMANGQRLSIDMFIRFQKELVPILPKWVINEFLNQVSRYKDVSLLHSNFKTIINQADQKKS